MKWKAGSLRYDEFFQKARIWHRWFVWHPVKINNHMIWLETVERRAIRDYVNSPHTWEYREINNTGGGLGANVLWGATK